jgi:hypothetical protein
MATPAIPPISAAPSKSEGNGSAESDVLGPIDRTYLSVPILFDCAMMNRISPVEDKLILILSAFARTIWLASGGR